MYWVRLIYKAQNLSVEAVEPSLVMDMKILPPVLQFHSPFTQVLCMLFGNVFPYWYLELILKLKCIKKKNSQNYYVHYKEFSKLYFGFPPAPVLKILQTSAGRQTS